MSKPILTQNRVRELLDYQDGKLIWRKSGITAGCLDKNSGYTKICLDYRQCLAHRIVWLWHNEELPGYLDHINHKRSDNRIENLRPASYATNSRNRRPSKSHNNPFMGIKKQRLRWRATITVDNVNIHLGSFKTLEEAIGMRITAQEHYGFHENHGVEHAEN